MDNKTAQRTTVILAIVMIIAIGGSAILPLFSSNNQVTTQQTAVPTATVVPTFAPAITDFTSISFDQDYLHSSGLFSVSQPTGWTPGVPTTKPDSVDITFNNAELLSVLQASLQIAAAPIENMDQLDAIYTTAVLNQSWSNYRNPRETARVRLPDNKLQIDFELQNARQQVFVARQISWWDTDWIYNVRVVTPNNQIDLLKFLSDKMVAGFKPNRIFAGTPADWQAYFDPTQKFILRFPSTWSLTDSAPGLPASIEGPNTSLRVEAQPVSAPLDEAAARTWVESSRAGATVVSVQPVTRGDASGFSVAYTYADSDGDSNSGLALLLNGPDNTLYAANLRIFEADVDLNTDTDQVSHDDLVKTLNSFQLLSTLNVPLPTPTPTVTAAPTSTAAPATATAPAPTTAPTVEATAEVTAEATTEPTAAPTVEATEEATAEASASS